MEEEREKMRQEIRDKVRDKLLFFFFSSFFLSFFPFSSPSSFFRLFFCEFILDERARVEGKSTSRENYASSSRPLIPFRLTNSKWGRELFRRETLEKNLMIDMTKSIKSIFSFASSFQNSTFENCPLVFGLSRGFTRVIRSN